MYAVILTGGKQYRVKEGDLVSVEKLNVAAGRKYHFDRILLVEDGVNVFIGTPILENALVRAEVVENFKDEKVLVFKKKRTKQFRRTRGHRQLLTRVRIERIIPDKTSVPPEELRIEEPLPPPERAAGPAAEAAPQSPAKAEAAAKKEAPQPHGKAAKKPVPAKKAAAAKTKPAAKTAARKTTAAKTRKKS
jgi:large subunit ribosomal protein L21